MAGRAVSGRSLTGRKSEAEAAIADFHGDDRLVTDYMQDEFLAVLDRDTLDFLVRTSVLDRLSGEVCDEVLARTGSAEMLRELVRSNLLIVPARRARSRVPLPRAAARHARVGAGAARRRARVEAARARVRLVPRAR